MSPGSEDKAMFPTKRLRRLRRTPALRALMNETHVTLDDLIYPIFVEEELDAPAPIESMPGVFRIPESGLTNEVQRVADLGIRAILLFGVSRHKDATGSDSMKDEGLVGRMVRTAKEAAPDILVIADICFCEFTDHGHCGVIHDGDVDNDATLDNLVEQTLVAARAGVDVIAPSGMMDGTIATLRDALDGEGFTNTPIMAYSTKFASAFYGPFREAAGTTLKGDRKTYQMQPGNRREGLLESLEDEAEGADILMVKPGMPYLDILADIRRETLLPLCVYQVSGEYSMIKFAGQAGALDEDAVMLESLTAFKRAGADLIITYFAPRFAEMARDS